MQKALPDIAMQFMDTWSRTKGITVATRNTRAKYLSGQLPTAKNLHRYRVKKTPICPCCRQHMDGGHHAVAWCPAIQGMVREKHNEAVRIITKAIAEGDKGASEIVYNDGGAPQKWSKNGTGQLHRSAKDIPAELLTPEEFKNCGSRPDIILYRKKQLKKSKDGYRTSRPAEITLVEIKFVRDTDLANNARDPHAQHRKLFDIQR